jgi:hypothetical protein
MVKNIDVPEVSMATKGTGVSALKLAQKLQINFRVLGRTPQSTSDVDFCILLLTGHAQVYQPLHQL